MLPLRPGDKLPQDPTFKDPPLWIHEVAAVVRAGGIGLVPGSVGIDRARPLRAMRETVEACRALLADEKDVSLTGEYRTGEEALTGILESAPQVLFLDVQMPGMDGFGLVQLLESHLAPDQRPFIVVVTAYDEYALRAFDVSAVDYLLKPFDRPRFRAALARARGRTRDRALADCGTDGQRVGG